MGRLQPGEATAIGLLAGGLGASAILVALGHEPTSTCVRRSLALKLAYGVIFIHMAFRVPGDPLTLSGHMIERALANRKSKRLVLPVVPST